MFVGGIFCDSFSTVYFMVREGYDNELHPAYRFMAEIFGTIWGPLLGGLGKLLAGLCVAIYCRGLIRLFPVYLFLAGSLISFWAAWYNIWGIKIYTPNFLRWIP